MEATEEFATLGSGVTLLVAAAELPLAGKRLYILGRRDPLGAFIHSSERTLPGFIHDRFSSWHPLFVSGAAYKVLGQELHTRWFGVLRFGKCRHSQRGPSGGSGHMIAQKLI